MDINKIQLNFNCRVNAQNQVLERSTLANIRADTVIEAVNLYRQLMSSLGETVIVSDHRELPQLPARQPARVPVATAVAVREQEDPGRCPRCNAGLVLRVARKGPRAGQKFYSCMAFASRGCLFTKPA